MPDKTIDDGELFQEAFVFSADFTDGTAVEIFIDAEFGTAEEAEIEATLATLAGHRVNGVTLADLLKRPEVGWSECVAALPGLASVSRAAAVQIENACFHVLIRASQGAGPAT